MLLRLRNGRDRKSWGEFHERYGELLSRYAQRVGATPGEAEDIVQEVEMYVFKAMGGFQHHARKGCFRAYLRAAVVHATERKAGKKARREATLDPHVIEALANEDPMDDEDWQREQRLQRVRVAMRSIAAEFEPVTLAAFRLNALADRSAAETADQLGISRESVYQAKSRILKRLRERLAALDCGSDI